MPIYQHDLRDGALYQLATKTPLNPGSWVAINGPHDKVGIVIKSEEKENGEYLNLIRGKGMKILKDMYIVASF